MAINSGVSATATDMNSIKATISNIFANRNNWPTNYSHEITDLTDVT